MDSRDWEWPNHNAAAVFNQVVWQVEALDYPPELMLLFHDLSWTIEALPKVVAFLREHGYVFKTYVPGYEFMYSNYSW